VLDLEKQARTVNVEVAFVNDLDLKDFLAGYSADVEIIISTKENVLRIPTQALLDKNKVYLYQLQDKLLHEKTVSVGLSNWDNTQVLEGLQENDYVVVSTDRQGLKDGVRAKIAADK
jgi:HlyD family secretion protein